MLDPLYPLDPTGPWGPLLLFAMIAALMLACEALAWLLRRLTARAPSGEALAVALLLLCWPAALAAVIWLAVR